MAKKRRTYRRKRSPATKEGVEEKILKHITGLKEEVLNREVLPWDSGRFMRLPYNPWTNHEYIGTFNLFMLQMRSYIEGWDDPRFITVGKAKELSGDFKGQTTTELWYPVVKKVERDEDEDSEDREERTRLYFNIFRVFNVSQVKGIDAPPLPGATWLGEDREETVAAIREHLTANFSKPPLYRTVAMLNAPSYSPGLHRIQLPPMSEYETLDRYVRSLIHETVHATGRELKRFKKDEYGSPCAPENGEYAFEEMVTEFATSALLTHYGLSHERRTSAAYILSWYRAIENDPKSLPNAIRAAMAAFRFVTGDNPLPRRVDEEADAVDGEKDHTYDKAA